jgi:hypothetical protein
MLFDLTFPCYLTTFSGKKCLSGKVICVFFPAHRSSPVLYVHLGFSNRLKMNCIDKMKSTVKHSCKRTASGSWNPVHFEDLFCIRKDITLYGRAFVAAETCLFEELFDLRNPALRTVDYIHVYTGFPAVRNQLYTCIHKFSSC